MKYETIGKTNTKISKITLGCMSFGSNAKWMVELDDARSIIECALDLGITFFDTANAYSNGRSEEILGDLLKGCRNEVVIGTKVRYQMGDNPSDLGLSKEQINKQIEKTIEKGCSIVLWPEQVEEKDINDMILSGMSKEEVQKIINENTFSGAGAKLRFAEWRKIDA